MYDASYKPRKGFLDWQFCGLGFYLLLSNVIRSFMSTIGQYLKDTQAELRHVAWPTQTQTIVYTILVVLISLLVSVYLGLFDYLFTSALSTILLAK